jgi:hypothetical protein
MPTALHSYKVDPGGKVTVRHTFYGVNDAAAEEALDEHLNACESFGPAYEAGATIEIYEDVPGFPDVAALHEIESAAGGDDEDEEEDEDDPDAEDEEDE